jgi:ssDNA-binding Zn-finger/Zn-ribbon topoisomerase 1
MIVWNLICPKCGKRMRFKVDVCPCMASEVELPNCPNCGEKMVHDYTSLKGRRRIRRE